MRKHYTTTIQTGFNLPGDLVPPGGRHWELCTVARGDNSWLLVWVREEHPCTWCSLSADCAGTGCHKPSPHCSQCHGSGWMAA